MNFKELVYKKVYTNDANWFYKLASQGLDESEEKALEGYPGKLKRAYYQSLGDGNELTICYKVYLDEDEFVYVQIEGVYSSWGSDDFYEVYFAKPYQYCETRYERILENA